MSFTLRDYQKEGGDAVFREWARINSTLGVAFTGAGKTVIIADLIRRIRPMRSIVIAHRGELLHQAKRTIETYTGLRCEIEKAEQTAIDPMFGMPDVVLAMVQTLNTALASGGKRMGKFDPGQFGLLVADECFVRGTPVDGVPIENIKSGDTVRTHLGYGQVVSTSRRLIRELIRVTLDDGRRLVCSPGHPFWVGGEGFVYAKNLTRKSMVLTIIDNANLPNMWRRASTKEATAGTKKAVRQTGMQKRAQSENNKTIVRKARRGDHSIPKEEWNERPSHQSTGIHQAANYGVGTGGERRERERTDTTGGFASWSPWLGSRRGSANENAQRKWLSELLQGGCWKLGAEVRHRSGWEFSQLHIKKGARCKEGGIFAFSRVASIEIFKQGSDREFDELCPDGRVYNLEVSNGNTYFANGVLVHNCHHVPASQWKNIIHYFRQNPDLRVFGCTATPDRHDQEALGQVFESVAFKYDILYGIQHGWLVPIDQQMVTIAGLDFSHIRTTAGDLNGADLAAVMEAERNLQGVAGAVMDIIGSGKRALVFTASVKQAETLSDIFNRHRTKSAAWVHGKMPEQARKQVLEAFEHGDLQIVTNCGVLGEGYDNPTVDVIVMARPTKSRSLYAQQLGRGTRPLKGVVDGLESPQERKAAIQVSAKPSILIVDFVGNSGRHKLITTADILGGNISDDAIEKSIKRMAETGRPSRVMDLLEEEEEIDRKRVEESRQREAARKARLIAKVKYNRERVDPFDLFGLRKLEPVTWNNGKVMTEGAKRMLRQFGFDPDLYDYDSGMQLFRETMRRLKNRLATPGQCRILKARGLPINVTSREAKRMIDEIATKEGWKTKQQSVKG